MPLVLPARTDPFTHTLVQGLIAAALVCVASTAWAQEAGDDSPDIDEGRFRGAFGVQAGPSLVVERGSNGGLTATGQFGFQANDWFAVYGTSSLGMFFVSSGSGGPPAEAVNGGYLFDIGAMVELTVADRFSIGVGPDAAVVLVTGDLDPSPEEPAQNEPGVALLGGQIHVVTHPMVERTPGLPGRKSLAVGADVRVLRGDGFSRRGRDATVVMPMLYFGVAWM